MWHKKSSYLVLGLIGFLVFTSFTQAPLISSVSAQSTDNANINHNFTDLYTWGSTYTRGVAVGKCHPDGNPRIILGNSTYGQASIYKQSGMTYILEAKVLLEETLPFGSFEPYTVYDFNEDGLPEILGNFGGNGVFIGWNSTDYVRKWEPEGDIIYFYDGAPHVCDIDRDGAPELITNTRTSTYIYSWNSGFTNFQRDAVLDGGAWFDVGVGDIDRDGEDEIITSSTPVLHVYGYNEGSYTEEYQRPYSSKDYAAFSVVDIDNDKELEIVGGLANVGGVPNYPITEFEWNGTGLDLYNITYSPAAHFDTHAGDVDGDGLPEVLLEGNGGQFMVVELAANGTVIAKDYSLSCNLFHRLYDFDNDSIQEIVTTDRVYQDDISLPPVLINTPPSTITVEKNSLGHNVSWIPVDRQNLTYQILWESSAIKVEDAYSGVPVVCSLDYRIESPGTNNLTIVVFDDDLNKANHSVFIQVVASDFPEITNVTTFPVNPTAGEKVKISANITDRSGIASADLYYQVDSTGWQIKAMIWKNDDIYQAEIGPFVFDQEIEYYIAATDTTSDQNEAIEDNYSTYYSFKLVDTTTPTITNVHHSPADPVEGDTIFIYADISDDSGPSTADIYFQTNGGGWTLIAMEYKSGIAYQAIIGSFSADTKIEYYIQATDASASKNKAIDDNNGNYYSIYVSSIPESSTVPTTTEAEEETSTELTTSKKGEISIGAPITITGVELFLLAIGTVFYRKNKRNE